MTGFVPYFSYREAAAALDWLETAFGFERTQDLRDDSGTVIHAELRFGDGRVMLGSGDPPPPDPARGDEPSPRAHGVYVVVEDVDAAHVRAVSAGARVVYPPEDTEFGTRRFRVLDVGGYEWSFGSYAPD